MGAASIPPALYNFGMPSTKARAYGGSVLVVAGITALALLLRQSLLSSDLTMLYLLGVVVVAISFGRGPAITAAVLGVLAFDFLFVPPHFTFRVSDVRYFVTFAVMLSVAVITGTLTARLREQREHARLMADQARRTQSQIEVERTRSAVLSSVSHDLRTPLTAITGAATALRDDAALGAATRRELAETIADEAQRLNQLIGNLLDVTRLESGALLVHKEWHSVEEVVGAALTRLGPALGDRKVQVSLENLPLIPMDDILFEQVVRNLVDNAIRHSGNDEPILVRGRLEEGELRLEVCDSGRGLSTEEPARVFDKFYRGTGPSHHGGAGLGLAICRGIVVAHGGTIEAANLEGGGAVFTVRLPVQGSPPTIESEAEPMMREARP